MINKNPKPETRNPKLEKGQVMLLTVLFLAAVFLSATVIAGILMANQLSRVTRIADSARAIFAADTAVERALFRIFRCNNLDASGNRSPIAPPGWDTGQTFISFCNLLVNQDPAVPPKIAFTNGASYQLSIFDDLQCRNHNPDTHAGNFSCLKATGRAGKSARAFEIK